LLAQKARKGVSKEKKEGPGREVQVLSPHEKEAKKKKGELKN